MLRLKSESAKLHARGEKYVVSPKMFCSPGCKYAVNGSKAENSCVKLTKSAEKLQLLNGHNLEGDSTVNGASVLHMPP